MTITFPESPLTIPQSQDLLITIETTTTADQNRKKKLTLIPLIFLIYFAASGGPHAEETAVHAAGPLFAILGFLIFPLIWSVPEALITAELSTAFPRNGGFVIWADRAFGPFWGSLMGTWRFFGGVFNIAVFPLLFIGYMEKLIPALESGWPRFIAASVSTLFLSFVNYTGVTVVGYAAVVLAIASLSPFILMCLIAVPKIHPHRWLSLGQEGVKKDWNLFFNILFWNLSVWDNASTLAGEVEKPKKNFPLALFSSVIFTYFAYLFPLLAVIGSVSADQRKWGYGFHADAAEIIGGTWLKYWIQVGAVLSAMGIFESQLSSIAYQLAGMADLGFLPEFFAVRSKRFNTPWVAILISTSIALAVSYMHLIDIILSANFLCSLGMLLEFASFIWLRRKFPALKRPFRVPMKLPGLVVMCLIPSGFLIFVMATATKTVYLISGVMTVGGIGWYFLINFCNKLFKFSSANHEFEQE